MFLSFLHLFETFSKKVMESLWRQAVDMALLWGELYWMDNVTDHCSERGRRGIRGAVGWESEKEMEEMRGCRSVGLQVAITEMKSVEHQCPIHTYIHTYCTSTNTPSLFYLSNTP